MRKILALAALCLLAGAAGAQNINKNLQVSQDPTGKIGYDTSNNIYLPNHLLSTLRGGTTPTVASCGSTGPAVVGTDFAGTITEGTTGTQTGCVLTFGTAFLSAPVCEVGWASGPLNAMSWTTSVTALTITQTGASSTMDYICTGPQ